MKAYFDNGKIRLEVNGVEHAIDGETCDILVNQLLTARHFDMKLGDKAIYGCLDCGEEMEPQLRFGYWTCTACGSQKLTSGPI